MGTDGTLLRYGFNKTHSAAYTMIPSIPAYIIKAPLLDRGVYDSPLTGRDESTGTDIVKYLEAAGTWESTFSLRISMNHPPISVL